MNKDILITGGAGYIGSACTTKLLDEGYSVTVFDNFCRGLKEKVDERAGCVEGDILDSNALEKVFASGDFDTVLHLAAHTSVPEGEVEQAEYFQTNTTGTLNVVSAMQKHGVPMILFVSSAAVYMPSGSGFYDEQSNAQGANVYGASKRCAERVIEEFTRTGAIGRAVTLRLFNIAGDSGLHFTREGQSDLFPTIARAARSENIFNVFGGYKQTADGSGVRDYVHINDATQAISQALSYEHSGTFNIGTGEGKSVLEVIKAFEQELESKINVTVDEPRAGDVPTAVADISYAKEALDWQPKHTLKDIVRSTLQAYGK